jgi:hypothetical protein
MISNHGHPGVGLPLTLAQGNVYLRHQILVHARQNCESHLALLSLVDNDNIKQDSIKTATGISRAACC